jgi:hypothetical protein
MWHLLLFSSWVSAQRQNYNFILCFMCVWRTLSVNIQTEQTRVPKNIQTSDTQKTAYDELHNLYFKYYYGQWYKDVGWVHMAQWSALVNTNCPFGGGEYLNWLVKYYPLNKGSAPWGLLYNFFPFMNVYFSVTKCDRVISNVQVVSHRIECTVEPLHILQQAINCLATYLVGLLKLQAKN